MNEWEDQIVSEVRKAREQYAERFGFDVKAICKDLRKRQKESGRSVVRLDANKAVRQLPDDHRN